MIQEEFRLGLRTASRRTAKDDDRGFGRSSEGQQRAEIGIGLDEHPVFASCELEDLPVGRSLHSEIPDVQCFVSGSSKFVGNDGRKRVIDQEPQGAERRGISLSLTATAA